MKINTKARSCYEIWKKNYGGQEYNMTCPFFHESNLSGPAYCSLILIETDDLSNALPNFKKCPLRRKENVCRNTDLLE